MKYLEQQRNLINKTVMSYLQEDFNSKFYCAAKYAACKSYRYRGITALEIYKTLGGNPEKFLKSVAGIEFMHKASLVLDDLPCMDNSSTRNGQPTVHIKYDESTAILCSLYLYEKGRNLLITNMHEHLTDSIEAELFLHDICKQTFKGQELDLLTNKNDEELLNSMTLKNGLFYLASVLPGYLLRKKAAISLLKNMGTNLALAYQLFDDLRDKSNPALTGKPVEADAKKNNYLCRFGIEKTKQVLNKKKAEILTHVKELGSNPRLEELIGYILTAPS